jgi:hypothetical protein
MTLLPLKNIEESPEQCVPTPFIGTCLPEVNSCLQCQVYEEEAERVGFCWSWTEHITVDLCDISGGGGGAGAGTGTGTATATTR